MDNITLDKKIIRALASETRVDILKRLDSRSMTLSKLTDDLNISKSTLDFSRISIFIFATSK